MTEKFERILPPTWPRPPHQPVPEPEPASLDERVDWMTYSHPELYSMVHSGLDLSGAMAVSATWARLGDELGDIGQELAKLLFMTAQAWEGDSAELAKASVSALADWSSQTGTRATEVSGCVTIQVDNAATARNTMPAPLHPVGTSSQPSQASAFTNGDFHTAAPLVADSMVYSSRERALHQQAAQAMAQFQESSRDVYATVPQFAPPDLRRMPIGKPPAEPPQPPPVPQPQPTPTPPVPGRFVGGAPGPAGPGGGPGTAGPGRVARPGAPLGSGAGTGAGPNEQTASRPAAASATPRGTPGAGQTAGGMPMGAGGSRGEDEEHRRKNFLKENEDIFGIDDQQVAPQVIGEVNRRA